MTPNVGVQPRPKVVVCADLHADAAQRVADELNAAVRREVAIGRACDVGREDSVRALIDEITRTQGVIDLYFAPTPNGWKLTILLEEAGLDYRIVPVFFDEGGTKFGDADLNQKK